MQKCPKTSVHDCRMTGMTSETRVAFESRFQNRNLDFPFRFCNLTRNLTGVTGMTGVTRVTWMTKLSGTTELAWITGMSRMTGISWMGSMSGMTSSLMKKPEKDLILCGIWKIVRTSGKILNKM